MLLDSNLMKTRALDATTVPTSRSLSHTSTGGRHGRQARSVVFYESCL